eukprot:CAMPEP_0196654866 /NCGR_PEP_ID=MMETSP1086-20130531/4602_1 /TAXON_ID=77921 /ORGANISM="Cyanoptyche  gloeocystis , Strain SAG4.97" /LENGTH=573 /DNA_ID=CAMNT_0041986873 /DNA_START=285 /DNA_END=2006 /DNA_ORIENTATION=+
MTVSAVDTSKAPSAESSNVLTAPPKSSYICASLTAETTEECIRQMAKAVEAGADLVEIRLDYIRDPDIKQILAARVCPAIVTNRPLRENGRFEGSEEERLGLLAQAGELGADYVDVEYDCVSGLRTRGSAKLILSYHNYTSTPSLEELRAIHDQMRASGADVTKVATFANRVTDNLEVFRLLASVPDDAPCIGLCMGPCGLMSRALAPKVGSFLTFAAMDSGKETAPGQLSIDALKNLYRFKKIGPTTKVHAIVGSPVAQSMSPAIHNAAFQELDLDCVYVPLLVAPEDLEHTIRSFAKTEVAGDFAIAGYSVTIPHKEAVLRLADEVDPVAQAIGAGNTLVSVGTDGPRRRYMVTNTDWLAAITAVEDGIRARDAGPEATPAASASGSGSESESEPVSPLRGRRVAVVGAGGAARALAFGVKQRGGVPVIMNRTVDRALKLAVEIGCEAVPLSDTSIFATCDVIMNASSVGMFPDSGVSPVPQECILERHVVFDSVYNPLRTRLVRDAEKAGAVAVQGSEMFIRQAIAQFELWTNQKAPAELMASTILGILKEKERKQFPRLPFTGPATDEC